VKGPNGRLNRGAILRGACSRLICRGPMEYKKKGSTFIKKYRRPREGEWLGKAVVKDSGQLTERKLRRKNYFFIEDESVSGLISDMMKGEILQKQWEDTRGGGTPKGVQDTFKRRGQSEIHINRVRGSRSRWQHRGRGGLASKKKAPIRLMRRLQESCGKGAREVPTVI